MDAHVPRGTVLLVSNTTVAPLYAAALKRGLRDRNIIEAILPDGESYKTLETLARILDVAVANRLARDSTVVALGGGVVGDMAGFAAACYQRGIDFVQVPTTLLAQVDSSVGGKTGVNHPGGKNLIGAFHQPVAVHRRYQYSGHAAAARTARGPCRGHQVRPDPRCRLL